MLYKEHVAELVSYAASHGGDPNVPHHHHAHTHGDAAAAADAQLGAWLHTQREVYKCGTLSAEHVALLRAVPGLRGFGEEADTHHANAHVQHVPAGRDHETQAERVAQAALYADK